jgi:ketosteroid isomerase-like protein
MQKTRTILLCILTLTMPFLPAGPARAQSSTTPTGTWFGDFILTAPDGKVSHDTAVFIVEQHGATLTGSIGRTVDQQSSLSAGSFDSGRLRFHLDSGGGMDFVLDLSPGHLSGVATGKSMNAKIDLKPAPGLMPHTQLLQEIALADQELYDAFSKCDVARYGNFLSKDLEFYQDRTGRTNYEQNMKAFQNRCAEGIRLRRELDKDSLIVNAAPGYGVIQAGTQRFYSSDQTGSEHLDATARFTNIWSKETGTWKLVRIISYDHH